jgi:hypothetical protein
MMLKLYPFPSLALRTRLTAAVVVVVVFIIVAVAIIKDKVVKQNVVIIAITINEMFTTQLCPPVSQVTQVMVE